MLKMHRYNEAFTFSGVIKSLSSFLISTFFLQNIAVLNLVEDLHYSWRILSFSIHFNYSAKLSSKHVKNMYLFCYIQYMESLPSPHGKAAH